MTCWAPWAYGELDYDLGQSKADLKYLRTHLGAEFHFRGTSPSYVKFLF